jgi:ceramide glucosyltransferase
MFSYLLLAIALIGTLSSTVFLGLALLAAHRFYHRRDALPPEFPGVSLLKPLHGMEPHLRENLESFFQQDYPGAWEILFCARSADDPGLALAREISAAYPEVKCRILTSGEPPWTNAKVWSLEAMLPHAQHDILLISDSDVEVQSHYLREVAPPFADEEVGMVTCLYRGVPVDGLWSRLEALGMSVEMTAGVLIANMMEGMKFALGPTMLIRKDVLKRIGGFAALADYCSDDFLLGNWTAAAGKRVVLSRHVIHHIVLHHTWASSWAHQVRWMKSTRFSRPKGHFGTGLTFAMPYGALGLAAGLLVGSQPLGWALFGWAWVNRMILCFMVGGMAVDDARARRYCWLYPLRDVLGFCFWVASYSSSVIDWRGQKYRLIKDGKMVPVDAPDSTAAGPRVQGGAYDEKT